MRGNRKTQSLPIRDEPEGGVAACVACPTQSENRRPCQTEDGAPARLNWPWRRSVRSFYRPTSLTVGGDQGGNRTPFAADESGRRTGRISTRNGCSSHLD